MKKQWPKEPHGDVNMFVADGELPLTRKDQTVLSDADLTRSSSKSTTISSSNPFMAVEVIRS